MPDVNPDILRWARETAGLGEEDAARKIGLNALRGSDRAQRLRLIEAGETAPTRTILANMAKAYRRPLLSFYLHAPPIADARIEDFRALPDRRPESEPLVQALVRNIRVRQALVQELLEDEEVPPHPFVNSATMDVGAQVVAEAITTSIGFRLDVFRAAATANAAFAYARDCAERAGVFVLLIGDLGSHHTEIDTEAFRGFALADPIAPFVIINDRDAHSAWAFTLFHELAHLWLGESGVSGARSETAIERFCNDAASRVLLPVNEANTFRVPHTNSLEELAEAIDALARPRRLSRTLIAFRLYQAGVFNRQRWEELRDYFRAIWRRERERRRAERAPDAQGPNPNVVKRHHLGPALIALIRRAVAEGALTSTKAGTVLGVRARNVDVLLSERAA